MMHGLACTAGSVRFFLYYNNYNNYFLKIIKINNVDIHVITITIN